MKEEVKILKRFADLVITEYKGYYTLERQNVNIGQTLLLSQDFKHVLDEFDKTIKENYPNICKLHNFLDLTNELKIDQFRDIEKRLENSNPDSVKYQYIIRCNLELGSTKYENQYLLVRDLKDLQTYFEIDLTGGFYFNCDFEVVSPRIIRTIDSVEELKKFCIEKNINVSEDRFTSRGIIAGAGGDEGFLVDNNLEAIGWINHFLYEVKIYEDKESYEQGEPFCLDIYPTIEEAKENLIKTVNANNYSGFIINKDTGLEEFSYYSNSNQENEAEEDNEI